MAHLRGVILADRKGKSSALRNQEASDNSAKSVESEYKILGYGKPRIRSPSAMRKPRTHKELTRIWNSVETPVRRHRIN